MAVESVVLTGGALDGIHTDGDEYRRAVAALPVQVCLGRQPPKPEVKRKLAHLADFVDVEHRAQTLPASTNWRNKAALAIARMYLNDTLGICVWASNLHLLGVTSANDSDSGGIVQATDDEAYAQYQAVCGPGDNGCVITDTLDEGVSKGWKAGGKIYKLPGYAALDWTNWDLCRAACQDFGGFKIGINLPSAWTSSATWDVTNSGIVGGHDVYVIDYDADFLYLSSWGRIYRLTKAAALSTRWLEEAYVAPAPTWTGPDKTAPSGYDVTGLLAAMKSIQAGQVPADPTPVVPPVVPPIVPPPVGTSHLDITTVVRLILDPKDVAVGSTGKIDGEYRVIGRG